MNSSRRRLKASLASYLNDARHAIFNNDFHGFGRSLLGYSQRYLPPVSPYWKNKWFINYVMEICFWLTQTFLLFYVLFRINGGELRVYVFLACLLGFAMYQALASA